MEAIFNRNGIVVAWLQNGEIFNLHGNNIGFINFDSVRNLNSEYKGNFTNGFFRDRNGNAVAFINGANNGPLPPIPQIPPVPPIPNIPNIHPIPSIPPIPPLPSWNWSHLSWNEFII